jgi:formylglycine-generating enzyme required for sulfatase activity
MASHTEPPLATASYVSTAIEALSDQRLNLSDGVTLALRQLPAGRLTMGRTQRERPWTREWPETEMNLGAYWLGTTEVTQAQFQAVTGMNPSLIKGDSLPVHSVIMPEMLAFCDLVTARERAAGRLGQDEEYRPPTEAEWEQAAMAGRRNRFVHGDDELQLAAYAWFDVLGGPRPVATKHPNRWGFYDMEGNILEIMCEHMFQYPGTPQNQHWTPYFKGYGGQTGWYAARGGAWNMGAVACEPTLRRAVHAESRTYFMGFRLARGPVLPELTKENARSPWVFFFAPYRASKAYAAVMRSAPAAWPRPASWKPAEEPDASPLK